MFYQLLKNHTHFFRFFWHHGKRLPEATLKTALIRPTGPWAEILLPAGTIDVGDITTATPASAYALAGSGGAGGVAAMPVKAWSNCGSGDV